MQTIADMRGVGVKYGGKYGDVLYAFMLNIFFSFLICIQSY